MRRSKKSTPSGSQIGDHSSYKQETLPRGSDGDLALAIEKANAEVQRKRTDSSPAVGSFATGPSHSVTLSTNGHSSAPLTQSKHNPNVSFGQGPSMTRLRMARWMRTLFVMGPVCIRHSIREIAAQPIILWIELGASQKGFHWTLDAMM